MSASDRLQHSDAPLRRECQNVGLTPNLAMCGTDPSAKRVAFLTHEPLSPPTGGGSAELVYLAQEAVRRGLEVHVFGPAGDDAETVRRQFGVRLHPFTAWAMGRYTRWRNLKYLLYPFFLERLVAPAHRASPFDALVSQHAIAAVAAGRLRRAFGVPVVMNFLDHLTGFMETWPAWLMPPPLLAVLKRYELSLPRRADVEGVLTVSEPLADLFAATGYPRARLQPMYYGYDARLFPFDPAALARRTDSPPTIVMHGSLDHHHLGPIALDAVATVRAARPDAVFKFIGHLTPALRRFLARVEQRGLRSSIQTTGFRPYRDVAGELSRASVGMVPYEESTGVHCAFVAKVVEYLGVGLPVVCTPLTGIRRYFAHEPLMSFAQFDGRDFGQRILAWLEEPLAARNARAPAASDRVRRELDWRVLCQRALDFIEERTRRPERSAPRP